MAPRPESIKKVMDVLGDFNPSEDKVKKTLGIGDEELKQVQEANSQQIVKDRIPINRRDTRKAQSTLGLNLSKEKVMKEFIATLMDILGVDEDTITEAEQEESELREKKIKRFRESIVISNKRALKKALTMMGCDPSSSKIMRTLGVSEDELSKDVSTIQNQQVQQQQLNNLIISAEITLFFVVIYCILYFANLLFFSYYTASGKKFSGKRFFVEKPGIDPGFQACKASVLPLLLLLSLSSLSLAIRITDYNVVVEISQPDPTIYLIGGFGSMGLNVSIYNPLTRHASIVVIDESYSQLSLFSTLLFTPPKIVFISGYFWPDNSLHNCTLNHYDLETKSTISTFTLPVVSWPAFYIWQTAQLSSNQSQFFVVLSKGNGITELQTFNLADGSPTGFSVTLPQFGIHDPSLVFSQILIDPHFTSCLLDLNSETMTKTLDLSSTFPDAAGFSLSDGIIQPDGTIVTYGIPADKSVYCLPAVMTFDPTTGSISIGTILEKYESGFYTGATHDNAIYMLVVDLQGHLPAGLTLIGYNITSSQFVLNVPDSAIPSFYDLIMV
ncbi:hypothetical protein PPL_12446 [Heterostelium album PN500]|uniref:Uncharacterized protein n=1 Tax=Heterostelium pallidum (strain ATCC 26659 / Pp 5 / PN500) TaxID=670386 RepID=D3BMM4_HETP5|nr:hypothetical protein PPL_12446 [Heterostelium album PN500]EFA77236.1 hypothetical protein PPL_12446 [Heterostelium album PN500]|eukprot:XP_020429365.1 hypothetical protein PPL_12446 [Heterostelium album PN500]